VREKSENDEKRQITKVYERARPAIDNAGGMNQPELK